MVKTLASISLIMMLVGCTTKYVVPVKLTPLPIVKETYLEWYWLQNGTKVQEYGNNKVVIMNDSMLQKIQEELSNSRFIANSCREVMIKLHSKED